MASSEFYKGKRSRRRNLIAIPVVILLVLAALFVVFFYSVQKYAVISKNEVEVRNPMIAEMGTSEQSGEKSVVHETADVTITYKAPDYSSVGTAVSGKVDELRAIFVPYTDLNGEKLGEYASRLSSGNALMLEMKPRSGELMWISDSSSAINYALNRETVTTQYIASYINSLKDKGIYLVAQISCCIDSRFTSYSTTVALTNSLGTNYFDDNGSWLDPYSMTVRDYTVELVRELWKMGFDEVVLADVMHPVIPPDSSTIIMYTREMTSEQSPVNAVCGFAKYVAEQLQDDKEGLLSIYVNSSAALVRPDTDNGQDVSLFFKLYDRVYYLTDKYAYQYNCDDVRSKVTAGKLEDRFVPVVYNYLPNNSSWILIDVEED